ncbi:MAG TPA: anti-sigma factor [Acidimicrobiales bacterium]|nr:anti-sigma factor [Acidimicrobiales bacterium]
MTPHEPFQELLGAYALDAVDDDERLLVEDHLRTCAACREEVRQDREVAAHLVGGGDAPPPDLWGRIAVSLHAEEAPGALGAIYPLAPRPPARRWAPALLAAAAVVAAALGVLGWQVARQSDQVDRLRAAVSAPGVARAAEAALADPRARVVVLASPGGSVQVTGVLEPDGSGYLVRAAALPALAAGMTYQLWGVVGAQTISLGVLGPSPSVVAFHGPRDVSALAITAEAGGGVVQSTHTPVVVGAVRA